MKTYSYLIFTYDKYFTYLIRIKRGGINNKLFLYITYTICICYIILIFNITIRYII